MDYNSTHTQKKENTQAIIQKDYLGYNYVQEVILFI